MRHGGDDCTGPPYCNVNPFTWGHQPDGYCYPDQLGPGGQAHPRYAQTMTDGTGWHKQLGQLGEPAFPDIPPMNCPQGQWYDMSQGKCVPMPDMPPGYEPPQGPAGEPGGVTDERPCTWWEKNVPGLCPPSGTMPGNIPPADPPGAPPPGTPAPPGTEQLCRTREQDAYKKGKAAERAEVIKTAAIAAAVSTAVGIAIGWALGS